MSKARARNILAGEVAASGRRPAMDVAERMLVRLEAADLVVVHIAQARAFQALEALDLVLDLTADPDEIGAFAEHIGIEDPADLIAACTRVREVLDGSRVAEMIEDYRAYRPATASA